MAVSLPRTDKITWKYIHYIIWYTCICLRGCEDEMCLRTLPDGGHPEECVWDSETDKFPIHIKTPPLPSFRPGLIGRVRVDGNGLRFVEDSVRDQDEFFVFKNVYVFLRPGTRRRANGVRWWADRADTSAARRQGREAADNAPPAGLQQEVSMGTSKCIESSFSWNLARSNFSTNRPLYYPSRRPNCSKFRMVECM